MRLLRLGLLALAAALALSACARPDPPVTAEIVAPATLEQLYASDRYDEVIQVADDMLSHEGDDKEHLAKARLFRALAWLAQDPHANQARVLLELRVLELYYADVFWGRIAALHLAALVRIDALQATLIELGFEQRELLERVEMLDQSLTSLHGELTKRGGSITALERERTELTERLKDAQTKADAALVRIRELEEELKALKQIDMERQP